MINYCLLFTVLVHFFFVQAEDVSGNVLRKPYSVLPQQSLSVQSKSTTTNCGCSHVLTFDDITTSNTVNVHFANVPNGYGGFNWYNVVYLNTTWEKATYGWNGYTTGLNSGIFVGLNANDQEMSMSVPVGQYFQLNSLVLASAWNSNLTLTITGSQAGIVLYQTIVTLQVTSKTTLNLPNWSGIDNVSFSSTGGTPYPNLSGIGTQFAVDDINISM